MFLGDLPERQHVTPACVSKEDIQATGLLRDLPIDIIQLGKAGGVGADAGCGLAQYGEGLSVEKSSSSFLSRLYHRE
jgi:hypothetical protein